MHFIFPPVDTKAKHKRHKEVVVNMKKHSGSLCLPSPKGSRKSPFERNGRGPAKHGLSLDAQKGWFTGQENVHVCKAAPKANPSLRRIIQSPFSWAQPYPTILFTHHNHNHDPKKHKTGQTS
eukprot:EG_transcript_27349